MTIKKNEPFVYHWPDHGLWACFHPSWDWHHYSNERGHLQCTTKETRREQLNGRTVSWFDTVPVFRLAFLVSPRKVIAYKRTADAPVSLPEQVAPDALDERLAGCYEPVHEEAVYRYEPFEVQTVTLTRAPGILTEGWESQLPYGYLVDPICAASAPCVMPVAQVWRRVVAEARRLVKERAGTCLTDDYENIGCVSVGKFTTDNKRVHARSFVTNEYLRSYGGPGHSTVIVTDIHGDNLADGQAKLAALLAQVSEVADTPTRECPRCKGCGEIGFTEPDVLGPPSAPMSKGRRR